MSRTTRWSPLAVIGTVAIVFAACSGAASPSPSSSATTPSTAPTTAASPAASVAPYDGDGLSRDG